MKVPYVDLPAQYKVQELEIDAAIKRVMSCGSFILRDDVAKLEASLAKFIGVKHVVGVNSGHDALFLALYQAQLPSGSEVITVGHTFVATIAAIVHCGASPVLVDIADDFNMDVSLLEKAITSRTKAILPVHLNGRMCRMDVVQSVAKKYGLLIIEDACQSLGALYQGRKAGSFGLGCFSAHPMKNLAGAGDGGFIATDDDTAAGELRALRNHGQRTKEHIAMFGFNSRLDNLQSAILQVKFQRLERSLSRRREIAGIYDKMLRGVPGLQIPYGPQDGGDFYDVYSSYCVCCGHRDELLAYLRAHDIEVFAHLSPPNHKQKDLGLDHFSLPTTEEVAGKVLSLPVCPELQDDQVHYVVQTVKSYFYGKKS